MKPLRAIIVDDEPPARALIREYLEDFSNISVAAECKNGREAVAKINAGAPDLLFLDVQMPGMDGFEVIERLDAVPHVIFSTAYDAYAVDAFSKEAVDYLLKPYSRGRFHKAVERVLRLYEERTAPSEHFSSLLNRVLPQAQPDRLYVQQGETIRPVATEDILWIEADGDYTRLHTAEKTYLSAAGIGALEERLDPQRFARVHRSTIVAFPALDHLRSDGSGGYYATLINGDRVRVSRTYAGKIRMLLG